MRRGRLALIDVEVVNKPPRAALQASDVSTVGCARAVWGHAPDAPHDERPRCGSATAGCGETPPFLFPGTSPSDHAVRRTQAQNLPESKSAPGGKRPFRHSR